MNLIPYTKTCETKIASIFVDNCLNKILSLREKFNDNLKGHMRNSEEYYVDGLWVVSDLLYKL